MSLKSWRQGKRSLIDCIINTPRTKKVRLYETVSNPMFILP
ncbi:MAG: hypothetical protein PT120_23405 [Aphanizomenon gracile PMC649.10]|nr:hypothetical protein [Aphanizomenon gracile PMC627.10]MDM3857752.1 hypothetical protein [Aphanizomenon gracile PMC649.10]